MRQWHQGKEGFMKVTRIQDKYNPDKVWMIKRYLCGTFYVNQEIKGQKFYDRDRRMTKRMLVSIGGLKRGLDMDDVKNNMLDIHLAAMETLEEQLRAGKLDPDDSS